MKKIASILLFMIPFIGLSQNYADKNYYLVDSLELDELIEADKDLLDTSLELYHQAKDDTTKIDIVYNLCESMIHEDWSKYQFFLHELIQESLKNNSDPIVKRKLLEAYGNSLNNIGFYFHSRGEFKMALIKYHEGLLTLEKVDKKSGMATSLINIGSIYVHKGNISEALNYFNQSIKIQKEINDIDGIASSLNNFGYIYVNQGNQKKGLSYFEQALSIRLTQGDQREIALVYNNIGSAYSDMGNQTKALDFYNKALKMYELIESKDGVARMLNNIGAIYSAKLKVEEDVFEKEKLMDEAIDNFQRSLKIRKEINDKVGIAYTLGNLASIAFERDDLKSAENFAFASLEIGKEIGYPELIREASERLSEVYAKNNKGMESLVMYQLFIEMRDSLNNLEIQRTIVIQQAKYEFDKQKAIDDLQYEKLLVIKREEKQKQKIITIAISVCLMLLIGFLFFVVNRLRLTKRQNRLIEEQKQAVEYQKNIVEQTHKEITDSINYAKHLQDAILPSFDEVNKHLQDNFILFKPKDIVSGDFYWFEHINGVSYIAAADCTGHGVPGAMVSVVCSNALNRALTEFKIVDPAKILDKTRELVIETFAKSGNNIQDGMDVSLCAFYSNKVIFAGANNSLWIIRKTTELTTEQKENKTTVIEKGNALVEYKANRQPVGLYEGMKAFDQSEIEINSGDRIYLFTDGFADQFGGGSGKKFKYKAFKSLLLQIQTKSMEAQKKHILNVFETWKDSLEQVDDVCIIGIKIN